jgi:hypothetical protein
MMRQFDADMRREHQLSHAEYIALDWLSESPITLGLNGLGAALPAVTLSDQPHRWARASPGADNERLRVGSDANE